MKSKNGLNILLEHHKQGYKYVSFDVFDTLLERPLSEPIDVHRLVGTDNFLQGDTYCNIRVDAEKTSRNEYCETTIEKINNNLYRYLDKKIADRLIEKEIELEKKILKHRLEGKEIYDKAKELDMTIIVISDMYLTEEFINEVLHKNGYDSHARLYVSGDYDAAKWNKKLYEIVIEDLQLNNPCELLHFGDNKHADYEMASELGIKSFHMPKTDRNLIIGDLVSSIVNIMEPCSIAHASIVRELYYQRKIREENAEYSSFYELGYSILGTTLLYFIPWIVANAKSAGVEKIFFMARDGEILHKSYREIYENEPIESEYILGSRRASYIPTLKDQPELLINYLVPHGVRMQLNTLLDSFPNNGNLHQIIKNNYKSNHKLRNALIENIELIKEDYEIEYNAAKKYYNDRCNGKKIAIVDIGWAGTLQRSIEEYLDQPSLGLYFGTFENFYASKESNAKGFIFDAGRPFELIDAIKGGVEVLEFLFAGCDASISKFQMNDGEVLASHQSLHDEEKRRITFTKELHRGAIDFIIDYKKVFGNISEINQKSNNVFLKYFYRDILLNPPPDFALLFTQISHAGTTGANDYRTIVSNINNFGDGYKKSYWRPGYNSVHNLLKHSNDISKYNNRSSFKNSKIYNLQKKIINKAIKKIKRI